MKQNESGLYVPEQEGKGRKFVSVRPTFCGEQYGIYYTALADDGTAWWCPSGGDAWHQLPALPPKEDA